MVDWCYHESYSVKARRRMDAALLKVARRQIAIAFQEAAQSL